VPGWLVAAVLTVFALVATVLFVLQWRTMWRHMVQTKIQVEAEVIALVERDFPDDLTAPTAYSARYRFIANNGQTYEVDDAIAYTPASHYVGQRVTLVHPEGRPQEAQPPRQAMRIVGVLLTGILMLIFIPVALFGWAMVLL
jgi:hypothetical protein